MPGGTPTLRGDPDGGLDLPWLLLVFQMKIIYGSIEGYQRVEIKSLR